MKLVWWHRDAKKKFENNYENAFFHMAKWTTIKLVPSFVITQGWELHHMDVHLAFLNGKIEEKIYIK
jgi:hypothetical protein